MQKTFTDLITFRDMMYFQSSKSTGRLHHGLRGVQSVDSAAKYQECFSSCMWPMRRRCL